MTGKTPAKPDPDPDKDLIDAVHRLFDLESARVTGVPVGSGRNHRAKDRCQRWQKEFTAQIFGRRGDYSGRVQYVPPRAVVERTLAGLLGSHHCPAESDLVRRALSQDWQRTRSLIGFALASYQNPYC